jgi:polyribonucleotide nucleotidyltransferase
VEKIIKKFKYGQHEVVLKVGFAAQQASGAVWVDVEGTTVLVTVVGTPGQTEVRDFFPLTVNYQERMYAAGRIPGGYFKREGRPTEIETLRSRLIDRPIRSLFPNGFRQDVQIVATVLSMNPEIEADIPALLGASAALALSGLPCRGPLGALRVGYIEGQWCINPTRTQMKESRCDLVMAGTKDAVVMVEAQAAELTEEQMFEALNFGQDSMQTAITAIEDLIQGQEIPTWDWKPTEAEDRDVLIAYIEQYGKEALLEAYNITEKKPRRAALKSVRAEILEKITVTFAENEEEGPSSKKLMGLIDDVEKTLVRSAILEGRSRMDGRDSQAVRPIYTEASVLTRTHGSALFQRGETQVLAVATIGTARDAQMTEQLCGEEKKRFMLHYNFPPFCVGEAGMMMGPKRREIGHAYLARRSFEAVLPSEEDYPYVLRVVSEVLACNGSSSMATICGTTMALLDAGVPLKASVAGIAMGLIKEGDRSVILTDILGDEDHLGDMDFKVAGTKQGITALQMDIKIDGINADIMKTALDHARTARLHILDEMAKTINGPRQEMSEFAPRTYSFTINPDKIRDIIGKGGVVIRQMTEGTGVSIDVSDDGRINIVALDRASGEAVCQRIADLTAEAKIGQIYEGKVVRIMDFGAFVNILPGQDGLVHISQLSHSPVDNVIDVVSVGQVVRVIVLDIDKQGRVRLSMKELAEDKP